MQIVLRKGDCLGVLKEYPSESLQAVLCDPPYGVEFMKDWHDMASVRFANRGTLTNMVNEDGKAKFKLKAPSFRLSKKDLSELTDWHVKWLTEAERLLVTGGTIKIFCSNRTVHRLAKAMHEVGFRDIHAENWLYLNGFPKRADRLKPCFEPIVVGVKI